jgi:hypothetical protein
MKDKLADYICISLYIIIQLHIYIYKTDKISVVNSWWSHELYERWSLKKQSWNSTRQFLQIRYRYKINWICNSQRVRTDTWWFSSNSSLCTRKIPRFYKLLMSWGKGEDILIIILKIAKLLCIVGRWKWQWIV